MYAHTRTHTHARTHAHTHTHTHTVWSVSNTSTRVGRMQFTAVPIPNASLNVIDFGSFSVFMITIFYISTGNAVRSLSRNNMQENQ